MSCVVRDRTPKRDADDVAPGRGPCLYTVMADHTRSPDETLLSDAAPRPTPPMLVNVVQAAEILSLSRSSIYQLIWNEQLVPIRIGRSVRFSVNQLERFVAEQASDTPR